MGKKKKRGWWKRVLRRNQGPLPLGGREGRRLGTVEEKLAAVKSARVISVQRRKKLWP